MTRILIFSLCSLLVVAVLSAPTERTTPAPTCDREDSDEDPDQVLMALDFETKSNLAVLLSQDRSRPEMRAILQRTIDMLDHRPVIERARRRETYNSSAKALGRALLHDPRFGSTSEESDSRPPADGSRDTEYCETNKAAGSQMSVITMKKILELRDKNRSHAAIKKIYPKYRDDKLDYYRRCVQQGKPITARIRRINSGVLNRIEEARLAGRAIHGYHIRRWGLELADEMNLSRDYFSASHTWLYKLKKLVSLDPGRSPIIYHGARLTSKI